MTSTDVFPGLTVAFCETLVCAGTRTELRQRDVAASLRSEWEPSWLYLGAPNGTTQAPRRGRGVLIGT